MANDALDVSTHYRVAGLRDLLDAKLGMSAPDGRRWRLSDFAALDQFHFGGWQATAELASLCELTPSSTVLDLGSGLGGPARYLATAFDCSVEGIDLSADFVDAARYLTDRVGLTDRVSFQQGDARRIPFLANYFDVVWTQHVAQNIQDRASLYREVARVLRPGGRFAIFDPVATAMGPPDFPLPWSRTPATSFLATAERMQDYLLADGLFEIVSWVVRTAEALAWAASQPAPGSPSPTAPVMTLAQVIGPDTPVMVQNFTAGLKSGRLALVRAVLRRTDK
jgi:SAM-dependent methyltransferase